MHAGSRHKRKYFSFTRFASKKLLALEMEFRGARKFLTDGWENCFPFPFSQLILFDVVENSFLLLAPSMTQQIKIANPVFFSQAASIAKSFYDNKLFLNAETLRNNFTHKKSILANLSRRYMMYFLNYHQHIYICLLSFLCLSSSIRLSLILDNFVSFTC